MLQQLKYRISKGMKGKPSANHVSKKKTNNDGNKLSTKTTATTSINGTACAAGDDDDDAATEAQRIDSLAAPSGNTKQHSSTKSKSSTGSGGSSDHTARSTSRHSSTLDDTCAINELLEGHMELTVIIVDRKEEIVITVNRRTPLLDLLVSIATQCHFVASNYTIQIEDPSSGGIRESKPSTPIGILDVNKISIVPKSAQQKKSAYNRQKSASNELPFLKTIRLQINLPRKQMMVKRISPSTLLKDIIKMVCEEKSFNPDQYVIVMPLKEGQRVTLLELDQPLQIYGTNEITLISIKGFEELSKQFSSSSLYSDDTSDRLGSQMEFCQSTPNIAKFINGGSQYKRIMSCNDSDYDKQSLSSVRTSRSYKKKPAPLPPPLKSAKSFQNLTTIRDEDEESNSTTAAPSIPSSEVYSSLEAPPIETVPTHSESKGSQPNGVITVQPKHSLSRQNSGSDSSGYHEMLSNNDTPSDSNSPAPPLSISPDPSESYSDSKSLVNKPVPSQRLSKCKSASKPLPSHNKKRRAPAAPPVISSSVPTEPNEPQHRIESPESEDLSLPNSLSSEAVSTSAASSSSFADESNLSSLHNQSLSPIVIIKSSSTANSSSSPQQLPLPSVAAAERAETDNELVTAKYVVIGSADGDISAAEQLHTPTNESNMEKENADTGMQTLIASDSVANGTPTKDHNRFVESDQKESTPVEKYLEPQVCSSKAIDTAASAASIPESQPKSGQVLPSEPVAEPMVDVQIKSDESPQISVPDVVANVVDLEEDKEKVAMLDNSADSNLSPTAATTSENQAEPVKDVPTLVVVEHPNEPESLSKSSVPSLPVVPAPRQTILARRQMLSSFSKEDDEVDEVKDDQDVQTGLKNGGKQSQLQRQQSATRCSHSDDGDALCSECNYYTSNFNRIRAQFSQLQAEPQPNGKPSTVFSASSSSLSQVNLVKQPDQSAKQVKEVDRHNSIDAATAPIVPYIAICPAKPDFVEELPVMDPPSSLVVFSEWKSPKDTDIYFSKSNNNDKNNNNDSFPSKGNAKSLDRSLEKQVEVTLNELNECLDSLDLEPEECDNLRAPSVLPNTVQSKLTVQNISNGHTKVTVSTVNQPDNSSSKPNQVVNQNGRTKVQLNSVDSTDSQKESFKSNSNLDVESAQNSVSSSVSFTSVRDGIRKFNTKPSGPGSNLTMTYSSSQYDLPSLRSPSSTPGGTLRRSSSRNSQVDSTEPPQVARKLNNFRIGSFKKDLNIYEEGPNQVKSATTLASTPSFPKPANQRQFHTVSGKISQKSPVLASLAVKESTKTMPRTTTSAADNNLLSGPQNINIIGKSNAQNNSRSTTNKNLPETVSFIQELKSRTGTWGSIRSGLTFNDEDTVENSLGSNNGVVAKKVEPVSKLPQSTHPAAASLQFHVNSKKIGAILESNMQSNLSANTNGTKTNVNKPTNNINNDNNNSNNHLDLKSDKPVAVPTNNVQNDSASSDHTSTPTISSVSVPIPPPLPSGSIPPPPPPPPADYHLTSIPPVSRNMVSSSSNDHLVQNSNTLLMPKGWSKSLKTVDSSIRNPLRSISVDNHKSNGYSSNGNKNGASSNGEVDSHAALLSEIKNFQNNKLKQVTSNEPFMLEIHGNQVKN